MKVFANFIGEKGLLKNNLKILWIDIFSDQVEILLPTSSSKVFPDMLEALESSQVLMMVMALIIVKITHDGNDDDDYAGKPGCVSNQPQRHHNGRCLPQDWRDD